MRIAIIGASGQFGADLVASAAALPWSVLPLDHSGIDIVDADSVREALPSGVDVIINTAAFHNLDLCERDPVRAFAVNATGVWHLANRATEIGARLIHVSTDYVFDGTREIPYTPADACNPVQIYGITKRAGESLALEYGANTLVVRVSGLYGTAPCRAKNGDNFVKTMLRLGRTQPMVSVVGDQFTAPTYTADAAPNLLRLATDRSAVGIAHLCPTDHCSWYEFAREIFGLAGMEVTLQETETVVKPGSTRRPKFSAMQTTQRIGATIVQMPTWRESLARYMATMGG